MDGHEFWSLFAQNGPALMKAARCRKAAKRRLVPLVCLMLGALAKARREGLLALEEDLGDGRFRDWPAWEAGAFQVVEGVDRDMVLGMLLASSLARGRRGAALLADLLAMSGVASLARGEAPWLARAALLSLLGNDPDLAGRVDRELAAADRAAGAVDARDAADARSALAALEARIAGQAAPLPCQESLLVALDGLDDLRLCMLLREVDGAVWTVALHRGPAALYERVRRNLAARSALDLTRMALESRDRPEAEVSAACERVAELAASLGKKP